LENLSSVRSKSNQEDFADIIFFICNLQNQIKGIVYTRCIEKDTFRMRKPIKQVSVSVTRDNQNDWDVDHVICLSVSMVSCPLSDVNHKKQKFLTECI
jgi:hypothetical protein